MKSCDVKISHLTFHFSHFTASTFNWGGYVSKQTAQKLDLWKKCIDLVVMIYRVTKVFPREEEFGLKSQLRRAAVSVPSNISEGLTRRTRKEKLHFLNIAQSSLSEIDAQIEISERLEILSENAALEVNNVQTDVEKLLSGLIRSLSQ